MNPAASTTARLKALIEVNLIREKCNAEIEYTLTIIIEKIRCTNLLIGTN